MNSNSEFFLFSIECPFTILVPLKVAETIFSVTGASSSKMSNKS